MIELQQQLADRNLADPDPPGLFTFLFGTHPPTIDRIGAAAGLGAGQAPVKVTVVVVGKVKAPFAEADAHYRKMLAAPPAGRGGRGARRGEHRGPHSRRART